MTIEQMRAGPELSVEDERRVLVDIIFDKTAKVVDPKDMAPMTWIVEEASSIQETARMYRDGEPTTYTMERYIGWIDINAPAFRGSVEGKQQLFGTIDSVLEQIMVREERDQERRIPVSA